MNKLLNPIPDECQTSKYVDQACKVIVLKKVKKIKWHIGKETKENYKAKSKNENPNEKIEFLLKWMKQKCLSDDKIIIMENLWQRLTVKVEREKNVGELEEWQAILLNLKCKKLKRLKKSE